MTQWEEYFEQAKEEIYDLLVELGDIGGYVVDWSRGKDEEPVVYLLPLQGQSSTNMQREVWNWIRETEFDIIHDLMIPMGMRLSEKLGGAHFVGPEVMKSLTERGLLNG